MSVKKILRAALLLCMTVAVVFSAADTAAYAREKSYYEISENTCDDKYNIILLGGGGDNKVFRDGKDYGKVNAENIISALDENKINVLSGHSTGANQVELFIRDGSLEDYIDVYVIVDGQAYVGEDRYCGGDTPHPVLIFMSDQMNRGNIYHMTNQYSNYKVFLMNGTKHVNIATEHFNEVVDLIREYCEEYDIEPDKIPEEAHQVTVAVPREIDIPVEISFADWNSPLPESVSISLYGDDEPVSRQEVMPDEAGNWLCTFTAVPRYVNDAKVEYRVEEEVEGYTCVITATDTGFAVENRQNADLSGIIVWMDRGDRANKRPSEVTLFVMNGEETAAELTVTAKDGWRWSLSSLPKHEEGKEIAYSVKCTDIPGYTELITGTSIISAFICGR